jgi:hypothetical protein
LPLGYLVAINAEHFTSQKLYLNTQFPQLFGHIHSSQKIVFENPIRIYVLLHLQSLKLPMHFIAKSK